MALDATAVILDAGRVLLLRRADFRTWALPGGGVEAGESAAQAAIREVREETGLDVALTALVGLYALPHWIGNTHSAVFAARVCGGALRPHPSEALGAGYFPLDRLPAHLNWWHRQPIRDAAAGVGGSAVWYQDLRWPRTWPAPRDVLALRDGGALPEDLIAAGLAHWGREPRDGEQRAELEGGRARAGGGDEEG